MMKSQLIKHNNLLQRLTWGKYDNISLLVQAEPIMSGHQETPESVVENKYLRIKPRISCSKVKVKGVGLVFIKGLEFYLNFFCPF